MKSARAKLRASKLPALFGSALFLAIVLGPVPRSARAYPPLPTPVPGSVPSAAASPPVASNVLPFDSSLTFVLDAPISSKASHAGDLIPTHLKTPLSVGAIVVAPAGTPASLRIVDVSPADIGDVYGFVDVYFEPMTLPDGRKLPLRAPVSRLAPNVSAGHESTVALEDSIEDQVVPYHALYHIFRKGKNFVLAAGSELPARTEATLTQRRNGTVAIETPQPLRAGSGAPASTFPVVPAATPIPTYPSHNGKTAAPLPTPSATPSPTSSPSPSSQPTQRPGG